MANGCGACSLGALCFDRGESSGSGPRSQRLETRRAWLLRTSIAPLRSLLSRCFPDRNPSTWARALSSAYQASSVQTSSPCSVSNLVYLTAYRSLSIKDHAGVAEKSSSGSLDCRKYSLHQNLPEVLLRRRTLHLPNPVARPTAQPQSVVTRALHIVIDPVSIPPVNHTHSPRPLTRGFNPDILRCPRARRPPLVLCRQCIPHAHGIM